MGTLEVSILVVSGVGVVIILLGVVVICYWRERR